MKYICCLGELAVHFGFIIFFIWFVMKLVGG